MTLHDPKPVPREKCADCGREVANEHDDGIHNTGECGCDISRALCWRTWAGRCVRLSPYDPSMVDKLQEGA